MKWIKASERLPEVKNPPYLVIVRWVTKGEHLSVATMTSNQLADKLRWDIAGVYEWLDESAGEELKEGGGMSSDQAVMAFAHHMNKQRGYETVHGTMYYNDADSDKPLTAVGIAEQWIQSQTGEQIKEG